MAIAALRSKLEDLINFHYSLPCLLAMFHKKTSSYQNQLRLLSNLLVSRHYMFSYTLVFMLPWDL